MELCSNELADGAMSSYLDKSIDASVLLRRKYHVQTSIPVPIIGPS